MELDCFNHKCLSWYRPVCSPFIISYGYWLPLAYLRKSGARTIMCWKSSSDRRPSLSRSVSLITFSHTILTSSSVSSLRVSLFRVFSRENLSDPLTKRVVLDGRDTGLHHILIVIKVEQVDGEELVGHAARRLDGFDELQSIDDGLDGGVVGRPHVLTQRELAGAFAVSRERAMREGGPDIGAWGRLEVAVAVVSFGSGIKVDQTSPMVSGGVERRRPSSVKRTNMGCLLWWWWRPEAKRISFRSIMLPPSVRTTTWSPRLLPSSPIQERTFMKKFMMLVDSKTHHSGSAVQMAHTRVNVGPKGKWILTACVMVNTSQPVEWTGMSREESSFLSCVLLVSSS
ncbi:hypothetical protein EYF80_025849 [Liparis tanakae]|uniref:Uncharacterized protein n=1 Tax=Liparis tanakae TaxID=230148 RepID=A0A4Z2HDX2_9TELE|nr:hypothetical protein EYF80_025849 [Liparis tanakae]